MAPVEPGPLGSPARASWSAIIDTGIWPEHPSFADNGLPAPPVTVEDIPATEDLPAFPGCDFGNTAHNPNDAPFTCNNKLIGARQVMPTYRALIGADPGRVQLGPRRQRPRHAHGVDGRRQRRRPGADLRPSRSATGPISGIAPRCARHRLQGPRQPRRLRLRPRARHRQAVADGVDVINYSIGGGADLDRGRRDRVPVRRRRRRVRRRPRPATTGPGAGTICSPAKVPWLTTVGANTQSRFFAGHDRARQRAPRSRAPRSPLGTGRGASPLVDAAATPGNGDLCIPARRVASSTPRT